MRLTSDNQIFLDQIFKGDPFGAFLYQARISSLGLGAITFAYCLFYAVGLPMLFGRISDALQDWPSLGILLVVCPMISVYYVWEPLTIQNLFSGLLPRVKRGAYNEDLLLGLADDFSQKQWFLIAIALGVLQAIYIFYSRQTIAHDWQSAHPVQLMALLPIRFMAFYAVTHIVIRQILATIAINRFLTIFPIEVAPLHPDKASGLRPLGHYVLSRGLIVGIVGLVLGLALLRIRLGLEDVSWEFLAEASAYMVIAPALFFLPLLQANRLMSDARERILAEIASRFEREYHSSLAQMRDGRMTHETVEEIDALQKMYDIAEKAPTWPLNLDVISKFVAAVVLPVFAPIVMDFFNGFLGRILK